MERIIKGQALSDAHREANALGDRRTYAPSLAQAPPLGQTPRGRGCLGLSHVTKEVLAEGGGGYVATWRNPFPLPDNFEWRIWMTPVALETELIPVWSVLK